MLGVGFVAYFMNLMKYPIAPLVIGVILGGLFDETFRRSLFLADGSLAGFVSRPGAAILLSLNIVLITAQIPAMRRIFARLRRKET